MEVKQTHNSFPNKMGKSRSHFLLSHLRTPKLNQLQLVHVSGASLGQEQDSHQSKEHRRTPQQPQSGMQQCRQQGKFIYLRGK